jgi:predicted enzyme related to lactoylglutathione lyase
MAGICPLVVPRVKYWVTALKIRARFARQQERMKAASLGAEIIAPPTDTPGVGRGATLRDPQGSIISLIQLAQPA